MFNTDPNRPIEDILNEIQQGSIGATNKNVNLIGAVLAPFAALLVRLSKDADETAKIVRDLTNRLYWLTVAVLVLTFLMFAVGAVDFYEKHFASAPAAAARN